MSDLPLPNQLARPAFKFVLFLYSLVFFNFFYCYSSTSLNFLLDDLFSLPTAIMAKLL